MSKRRSITPTFDDYAAVLGLPSAPNPDERMTPVELERKAGLLSSYYTQPAGQKPADPAMAALYNEWKTSIAGSDYPTFEAFAAAKGMQAKQQAALRAADANKGLLARAADGAGDAADWLMGSTGRGLLDQVAGMPRDLASRAVGGTNKLVYDTARMAGDLSGVKPLADFGAKYSGESEQFMQQNSYQPLQDDAVWQGIQSTAQQLPGIAATMATGNAAWGLGHGSAMSGTDAYSSARNAGYEPITSLNIGLQNAAYEYLTEKLPMEGIARRMGGKIGPLQFALSQASEVPGELVAQAGQSQIDQTYGLNGRTAGDWNEYQQKLGGDLKQAAIGALVGGSVQAGLVHAMTGNPEPLRATIDPQTGITNPLSPEQIRTASRLGNVGLPPSGEMDAARAAVAGDAAAITQQGTPGPADGMTRYYHGGLPERVDGPLWFTSDLRDAEGWAARDPNMGLWYVDVPSSDPARGGSDEYGVLPSARVEFPAQIANNRQPFVRPAISTPAQTALMPWTEPQSNARTGEYIPAEAGQPLRRDTAWTTDAQGVAREAEAPRQRPEPVRALPDHSGTMYADQQGNLSGNPTDLNPDTQRRNRIAELEKARDGVLAWFNKVESNSSPERIEAFRRTPAYSRAQGIYADAVAQLRELQGEQPTADRIQSEPSERSAWRDDVISAEHAERTGVNPDEIGRIREQRAAMLADSTQPQIMQRRTDGRGRALSQTATAQQEADAGQGIAAQASDGKGFGKVPVEQGAQTQTAESNTQQAATEHDSVPAAEQAPAAEQVKPETAQIRLADHSAHSLMAAIDNTADTIGGQVVREDFGTKHNAPRRGGRLNGGMSASPLGVREHYVPFGNIANEQEASDAALVLGASSKENLHGAIAYRKARSAGLSHDEALLVGLRKLGAIDDAVLADRLGLSSEPAKTTAIQPTERAARRSGKTALDDSRLTEHGAEAERMARDDSGWAEVGGKIIRDPQTGEVTGRTSWIPRAPWWAGRPERSGKRLNERETLVAVQRARRGEPLSLLEKDTVQFLLDEAESLSKAIDEQVAAADVLRSGYTELSHEESGDLVESWDSQAVDDFDFDIPFTDAEIAAHEAQHGQATPFDSADHSENAGDAWARTNQENSGRSQTTQGVDRGTQERDFTLSGETESEIQAREAQQRKQDAERRQRDNAPSPDDFTLTGSDRQADVAAAHGARDLFDTGNGGDQNQQKQKSNKERLDQQFNVSGKYPARGVDFVRGIKSMIANGEYKGKRITEAVARDADRLLSALLDADTKVISTIHDKYFSEWNKLKSQAGTQRDRFVSINTAKVELFNVAHASLAFLDGTQQEHAADAITTTGKPLDTGNGIAGQASDSKASDQTPEEKPAHDAEALRKQLIAVEDAIMAKAGTHQGQHGGDIEAAMRSKKVPVTLKNQRTELRNQIRDSQQANPKLLENATAPEHVQGVDDRELGQIVKEFNAAQQAMIEDGERITHVFDPPAKQDVVRLNDKVKVYHKDHGWMTPAQARAKVKEWKAHAQAQGKDSKARSANSQRVVLSLFDLSGEWSKPWEEAGYQVYRFDIQDDPTVGDVNNFSTDFFSDWFGDFDGQDIYAILAACPCTDFAVSGARHFAAKDADGRTVASVKLVHQTLRTIEYFKPAVWALENPVGRIEELGGLPPWRLSFDPNHLGDPYTKKTLIWGRFNGDLPVAPVEPTEGSKMHKLYGGKSQKTKNARSVTPEGFSYGFFMANNAHDNPAMAIANKYDRLDRDMIEQAVQAGVTEREISDAVDDAYYMDLDDYAANEAIRELIDSAEPAVDEAAQGGERLTPSSAGDLVHGAVVVDGDGKEYLALGARHDWLEVAPIVDGKAQVSADTTIRFLLTPEKAAHYPERRADPVYATGRNLYSDSANAPAQPESKPSNPFAGEPAAILSELGGLKAYGDVQPLADRILKLSEVLKDEHFGLSNALIKAADALPAFVRVNRDGVAGTDAMRAQEIRDTLARTEKALNPEAKPARGYISPKDVDHVSVGAWLNYGEQKAKAWLRVKQLRQQIKDGRHDLRVELIRAESAHKDLLRQEAEARDLVEKEANKQGLTTKKVNYSATNADTARMRDQPALRRGMRKESAEIHIENLTQNWANKPPMIVVQDWTDLPLELAGALYRDGTTGSYGLYYDGKVYLIASNNASPRQLIFTAIHETLGHHGLRAIYGDKLEKLLARAYDTNAMVKEMADAKGRQHAYKGDDMTESERHALWAEEALADLANLQDWQEMPIVRHIVAQMKAWLRKLGVNIKFTDDDIRLMLANARRHVEGKGKPAGAKEGVRYSANDGMDVSESHDEAAMMEFESIMEQQEYERFADRFLSNFPKNFGWRQHSRKSATAKSIKAWSLRTEAQLRGSAEELVSYEQALGPFSGYSIEASTFGDPEKGVGALEISVYGNEQAMLGLTDSPAIVITLSPAGELIINGPSPDSETFREFQKRGWADYAKDGDGNVASGFTELQDPNAADKSLPNAQIIALIGDAHARMKTWTGQPYVGMYATRSTGATAKAGGGKKMAFALSHPNESGWEAGRDAQEDTGLTDLKRALANAQESSRYGFSMATRLVPTWHIAQAYAQKLPSLLNAIKAQTRQAGARQKLQSEGDARLKQMREIQRKHGQQVVDDLADLMNLATVWGVDPAMPLPSGMKQAWVDAHTKMATFFKGMPADVQQLYRDMRDDYQRTAEQAHQALIDRINRDLQGGPSAAKLIRQLQDEYDQRTKGGVYFPLGRAGDYVVTGSDGSGRVVIHAETQQEAAAQAEYLRSRGYADATFYAKDQARKKSDVSLDFVRSIAGVIEGQNLPAATEQQLLDEINQLFIQHLPDASARKNFLHRAGTPGAGRDVMRNYARVIGNSARMIANLQHGDAINKAMQEAMKEAKAAPESERIELQDVVNMLNSRQERAAQAVSPFAMKLNSAAFVFAMGLNLSTGVVNLSQVPTLAYPWLAAKYSTGAAVAELGRAGAQVMRTMRIGKGAEFLMDAGRNPKLSQDERDMLQALEDLGLRDMSAAMDLLRAAQSGQVAATSKIGQGIDRAMLWMGYFMRASEVANRDTVALATYRLAKKANPQASMDKLVDEVTAALKDTQFDYSIENRPTIAQGNLGHIAFLFKNYAFNLVSLQGRMLAQSLNGLTPTERREARRFLVRMTLVQLGMAGMLGAPVALAAAVPGAVVGKAFGGRKGMWAGATIGALLIQAFMMGLTADDDEAWDWDKELRQAARDLAKSVGGGAELADVFAKGLPTTIGMDIASRVGMQDLFMRDPGKPGAKARDQWLELLAAQTGAIGMFGDRLARAIDASKQGDDFNFVMQALPAFMQNAAKAGRLATQGARDSKGVQRIGMDGKPVRADFADIVLQAAGFRPADIAREVDFARDDKTEQTLLGQRKQELLRDLGAATQARDQDAIKKARDAIKTYNSKHDYGRDKVDGRDVRAAMSKSGRQDRYEQRRATRAIEREAQE